MLLVTSFMNNRLFQRKFGLFYEWLKQWSEICFNRDK